MPFVSVPLIVLILVEVGITILVVKAGAIALRLTGLEEQRARFQALSAITNTGFTTRESELIVGDPQRRKIVSVLMIFGNIVMVTLIGLMVGSFATLREWFELPIQFLLLLAGGGLLYLLLRTGGLTRRFSRWIDAKLAARMRIAERSIFEVLALAEGHGVAEVCVPPDSPWLGKTLAEAGLRERGLLVLAIRRRDGVLASPKAFDQILAEDRLICYGQLARMQAFVGPREAPPGTATPESPAGEGPGPTPDVPGTP